MKAGKGKMGNDGYSVVYKYLYLARPDLVVRSVYTRAGGQGDIPCAPEFYTSSQGRERDRQDTRYDQQSGEKFHLEKSQIGHKSQQGRRRNRHD
jgi:hypothetical protein